MKERAKILASERAIKTYRVNVGSMFNIHDINFIRYLIHKYFICYPIN